LGLDCLDRIRPAQGVTIVSFFASASQVLCEKAFCTAVELHAVFFQVKAVSFVWLGNVLYLGTVLGERSDHLVRVGLIHARIVAAVCDQQGRFDPGCVLAWRYCGECVTICFRIADHCIKHLAYGVRAWRQCAQPLADVGDRTVCYPAAIEFGRKCEAGERRVTAIGYTINSDTFRGGDFLVDESAYAIGDVILHRPAPLFETRLDEGSSVADGAAIVDLQHCVSAVGEKLDLRIRPPLITRPRAAVDHD
jgi:hypothetical protein